MVGENVKIMKFVGNRSLLAQNDVKIHNRFVDAILTLRRTPEVTRRGGLFLGE